MKKNGKYIATDIETRFEEAARTLRRLPDYKPGALKSAWPEIVQSIHTAYGYDPARIPRVAPSPKAISEMEEAFGWLLWLEPVPAHIVWMRAEGMRWRTICTRLGLTRSNAWTIWVTALLFIANRLNRSAAAIRGKQKSQAEKKAEERQTLL